LKTCNTVPATANVHAQASARFASPPAQIAAGGSRHRQARQHRVAIGPAAVRARLSHHDLHAEASGNKRRLVGMVVAILADDFLQPHHVCLRLRDDPGDAGEIETPIHADAPVNVVAGDRHRGS
jgi:hypothetical protein